MKESLVPRGHWAEQSNETHRESVCASSGLASSSRSPAAAAVPA
jgi:hypothetical protein